MTPRWQETDLLVEGDPPLDILRLAPVSAEDALDFVRRYQLTLTITLNRDPTKIEATLLEQAGLEIDAWDPSSDAGPNQTVLCTLEGADVDAVATEVAQLRALLARVTRDANDTARQAQTAAADLDRYFESQNTKR